VVLLLCQTNISTAKPIDCHSHQQAPESQRMRTKLHQGLTALSSCGKEAHYQGKEGSSHRCCPLRHLSCEQAACCFSFLPVLFARLKSSPFSHLSFQNNNKKIPFLLNFLSIHIALEKAGHMQVTFNLIPRIDFNGCKTRIPENNVFELTESASSFPPCLLPAVSKYL